MKFTQSFVDAAKKFQAIWLLSLQYNAKKLVLNKNL